jgi:ankyrin repeat protein
MQWICFAIRPLSLGELCIAMTLGTDKAYTSIGECRESLEFSETDEEMEKKILYLSQGLAEVGGRYRRVAQLIHQSVKDFLIDEGLQLLGRFSTSSVTGCSHYQLARSCLRYLSMEEIQADDIGRFRWHGSEFSFLEYCTTSWILHSQIAEKENFQQCELLPFFYGPTSMLQRWIQIHREIDEYGVTSPVFGSITLHIASKHGLVSILRVALTPNIEADIKDGDGQTPLLCAARYGHKAILKLLLERDDVNADSKDSMYGRTPLFWAAEYGHETVVKLLLERDVEFNSKDNEGRAPLWWAALKGHKAVVKLLLERDGVNADWKDVQGRTVLSWAAERGYEAVAKLLLEQDSVSAGSKDNYDQTPLSYAAMEGHEAVAKLLLERDGVDVDSKNTQGQTPLLWAAGKGHEAVVKLLLEQDSVNVDSKDNFGRTPLSYAARYGYEAIVKLLLERGAEADSKDGDGRTPLSWAAERGCKAMAKLLLERGDVDANSNDNNGRTPCSYAIEFEHEAVVDLFNIQAK